MSQIDVNIIEPIPYLQIMQGIGPKGDKGDKGDPGEVTQAEFDELSEEVEGLKDSLYLTMENIFDIGDFRVSVDGASYSKNLLVQNGSTYGSVYLKYGFSIPPSSLGKSAFLSWMIVRSGGYYQNAVDVSDNLNGTYHYGETSSSGRKPTEPIITGSVNFYLEVKNEGGDQSRMALAKLIYCDKIHYGVAASGTLTDNFLLSTLSGHTLSDTKTLTFSVNAGAGEYIWVALPTLYGTPKFTVGGFDGGFTSQGSFTHTNNLGHTSNYTLWRSDNTGLGNVTVIVS